MLEAPRPPPAGSWREADPVCRVTCSNGPARGMGQHPNPAQLRFQSTAISRDDLTPQDTVETATISNCSGKGSTHANGYRENCTLTNLTTSRKCQTTALQHALPQGSAGRVRVSKWTVRAVTRKGLRTSSPLPPRGCRRAAGMRSWGGGGWRPLPPQSLCLWALASCPVRAEDQGPS